MFLLFVMLVFTLEGSVCEDAALQTQTDALGRRPTRLMILERQNQMNDTQKSTFYSIIWNQTS